MFGRIPLGLNPIRNPNRKFKRSLFLITFFLYIIYFKEEAYIARVKELEDVTEARNEKRKEYDDLRKQRLDNFMKGFGIITSKLKEMYQVLNKFFTFGIL